jgi:putative membrane-bound dehydrogenase-like protein
MMRIRLAVLFTLLPLALSGAAGPGLLQNASFVVADDLEVALWAESPMFFNPTNIDVDARGRVWVAEAVNYRSFNTAKLDPLTHAGGDRIVILEDTTRDGRADTAKVFVQDPDLRAPLGLAVIGNRVVVSASPHLIVYTDDDGDDIPDRKEILLTGFGGYDHDHGLHALVAGPDGRWYFNAGNAGPHVVTDRSGWTLRAGSLYTGGSPYNLKNQGGMVSDDGRVWVGGVGLRMEPDGTRLTVLAHNFRNAYELAVDSYGDLWQNDNDDQVMTCRTTWLMEGANAGYFSADGTRYWQADRRPGQDTFTAHWHQEDPGVLPAGDNTGAGAPSGIVRYESDLLGPRYRGLLLSADAGRNVIFGYLPQPTGAGFALDRFDVLSSLAEPNENYIWDRVDEDRRKWFRPSDVAVGADGALYVADWYDPIVGGHQMHDRRGYGRIYRITPKGRTLSTPRLDLQTTEGQIQALLSPAVNVRNSGFERLKAQGTAALPAVRRVLTDQNPFHRARAVWLLAGLGPAGVQEVERLLDDDDPQIRITAFRALRHVKHDVLAESGRLVSDPSPAVRREVALALRDVPFDRSGHLLLALAAGYDGRDRWYLEALGIGASGKEEALYAALVARPEQADPVAWAPPLADLAWRLHPAAAIDAFTARAASPVLSRAARTQALTALGFVSHPRAAQAMADLSGGPPGEIATAAAWWLAYRKSNDWRDYTVEGWSVPITEARSVPRETLLAKRALVLDGGAPIDRRIDAALALAGTEPGGRVLIALAAEGRIAYQLREAAGSLIFMNPDRSVRAAATGYFPRPGGQTPMRVDAVTRLSGDPARGEARYQGACTTCHRRGDTGADVGPDLTAIHTKFDRAGLIDAIVQPNAAIAFGFAGEVFVIEDDDPRIGFLQADGTTVSIRDGYGRLLTFDRERVTSRLPLKSSLMPDPVALGLNEQDVADIAAYLMR